MLALQDEAEVEDLGFKIGELACRAQHPEDVLRCGELRYRVVQVHARVVEERLLYLVCVSDQRREISDQRDRLFQHVRYGCVIRIVVITVKSEDASRYLVHQVARRRHHDHVAREPGRELSVLADELVEFIELLLCGKITEVQKEGRLFEAEAVFLSEVIYKIFDIVAAIVKISLCRHFLTINHLLCAYI